MVEDVLVQAQNDGKVDANAVLILVVVEDVLVRDKEARMVPLAVVLILVVVEDVLVPEVHKFVVPTEKGLNPCCGGRCSSTC